MIRLRADSTRLRQSLREREVQAVFRNIPDDTFDEALELGAGDGAQSRILARYVRRVLCTDLNADRLVQESHPKITYEICDAEDLPYESGRFDLIYSSNLLEHLPQPALALSEMRRVLRDGGVMVHVIPNRFWKLLHLSLFYPSQVVSIAEILLSRERRRTVGKIERRGNNLNGQQPSFIMRSLWPPVHGEYPNHWVEFVRMGASYWERMFSEAGFQLAGRIAELPAHSPYRFGMEAPRKVLETLGFSTCNGYILTKQGHPLENARVFDRGK